MLMNNKYKAQTLTGNFLNMSCSFGQTARSIENKRVVILRTYPS